ncbi:Frag1/DRAM/Sfk1, partial [Peziza echinospora]
PLWVLPLISASAWFIMLWAMLITYLASGRPFYPSMERGNLAYISDIGAFKLRPLFITFSTITSIFFLLSLLAMRFHQELSTRYERLLDLGALLSGFLGAVGLILLSIFDTNKHGHLHALFLFFFMFGVCLSALFSTLEYRRLGKTFTEHRILKWSFRGKAAVFVVEIALSVAFAVLMSKRMQNQAAAVEWVVAFVFTFYLCTFVLDLVPHARTKEDLGRE